MYIARLIEKASDEETRENLLRATAVHTPVAWGHINMLGEYDFAEEKLKDVLGILPPEIYYLKLCSKREAVIEQISWKNRTILEIL